MVVDHGTRSPQLARMRGRPCQVDLLFIRQVGKPGCPVPGPSVHDLELESPRRRLEQGWARSAVLNAARMAAFVPLRAVAVRVDALTTCR